LAGEEDEDNNRRSRLRLRMTTEKQRQEQKQSSEAVTFYTSLGKIVGAASKIQGFFPFG